jgi:hypothetical protein
VDRAALGAFADSDGLCTGSKRTATWSRQGTSPRSGITGRCRPAHPTGRAGPRLGQADHCPGDPGRPADRGAIRATISLITVVTAGNAPAIHIHRFCAATTAPTQTGFSAHTGGFAFAWVQSKGSSSEFSHRIPGRHQVPHLRSVLPPLGVLRVLLIPTMGWSCPSSRSDSARLSTSPRSVRCRPSTRTSVIRTVAMGAPHIVGNQC